MGLSRLYSTTISPLYNTTDNHSRLHSAAAIMGNSRSSLQLQPEDITAIQEETGFNQNQIERLYSRFSSLDKQDKGYLSREDFLHIPELAINPLGDRIVHAFFFESRSQEEEKVDFRMYDLDGDDKISKEELLAVLTMMVGNNISTEQLISIAERTIQEADVDKDNLISFEEFAQVLARTDVEQKMSIRFLN